MTCKEAKIKKYIIPLFFIFSPIAHSEFTNAIRCFHNNDSIFTVGTNTLRDGWGKYTGEEKIISFDYNFSKILKKLNAYPTTFQTGHGRGLLEYSAQVYSNGHAGIRVLNDQRQSYNYYIKPLNGNVSFEIWRLKKGSYRRHLRIEQGDRLIYSALYTGCIKIE